MPAETPLPETPPETPPENLTTPPVAPPENTPSENEFDSKGNPDFQNSIGEKIRHVGRKVFDAAGIPYRAGRGRPKKDGTPKISDIPLVGPSTTISAAPTVGQPVVPSPTPAHPTAFNPPCDALFRRSVASAVRGLLGAAKAFLRGKATQAGLDRDFTERAMREAEPEEIVLSDFSESLEIVLKKHNVQTENAPEIALAVALGRMAVPYAQLLKTLNAEIARRKKEGK
jgi:hypothetical protein